MHTPHEQCCPCKQAHLGHPARVSGTRSHDVAQPHRSRDLPHSPRPRHRPHTSQGVGRLAVDVERILQPPHVHRPPDLRHTRGGGGRLRARDFLARGGSLL